MWWTKEKGCVTANIECISIVLGILIGGVDSDSEAQAVVMVHNRGF